MVDQGLHTQLQKDSPEEEGKDDRKGQLSTSIWPMLSPL
jgi:hypothetical protein